MALLYVSVLLVLLQAARSEYMPEICTIFKVSNGLIPPPLPRSFEMKGEHVDYNTSQTVYQELYFDYVNSRAKYMMVKRGLEAHYLFNYETYQILTWMVLHPGLEMKRDPLSQACTTVEMRDSPYHGLFGYRDTIGNKPKMYNSNEVLRYGGQYQLAANGSENIVDRGLPVDNFASCLYDSTIEATLLANFSFSTEHVETSGATEKREVLGPDDGYLSVPVRMKYVGQMEDDGKTRIINTQESVSWFKGEPEFKTEVFQIPPFLYCKGYRGQKEMPKLPTAFYTRMVVTQYMVDTLGTIQPIDSEGYREIFYYAEKRLARIDYTITPYVDSDVFDKFQSLVPISSINDFNIGLQYTISKPTGRCFIRPIPTNSFFDAPGDLLFATLATPEQIFLLQTDEMEYKGKAYARDIYCDVWTGQYYDEHYNSTYIKETYFSTNDWHEEANDVVSYKVPVKHSIIRKELDGDLMEGVGAYNFLKFMPKPPLVTDFDIHGCVEQIDHKTYAIKLSVTKEVHDLIFKYKTQFLETAQYHLTDLSQVITPLRVQRLHLRHRSINNATTFLVFTLLDKVNFRNNIMVPQKGADLQEASNRVQRQVDESRFAMQFFPPYSKEASIVTANAGDMYLVKADGVLTLAPLKSLEPKQTRHRGPDDNKKEEEVEEKKGMSPGGLTLLAFAMLFIGVGIGIAVMYLYMRMYSSQSLEEKIGMQNR